MLGNISGDVFTAKERSQFEAMRAAAAESVEAPDDSPDYAKKRGEIHFWYCAQPTRLFNGVGWYVMRGNEKLSGPNKTYRHAIEYAVYHGLINKAAPRESDHGRR